MKDLMPIFSSGKSWSQQAREGGGLFHPEKKCPPVDDCNVKTFLGTRREPSKTKKQLKAENQQDKKEKKEKKEKQQKSGGWPFAGSYDPHKGKGGKGKSRGKS